MADRTTLGSSRTTSRSHQPSTPDQPFASSKQSKPSSKSASKPASQQASKRASKQATNQTTNQTNHPPIPTQPTNPTHPNQASTFSSANQLKPTQPKPTQPNPIQPNEASTFSATIKPVEYTSSLINFPITPQGAEVRSEDLGGAAGDAEELGAGYAGNSVQWMRSFCLFFLFFSLCLFLLFFLGVLSVTGL